MGIVLGMGRCGAGSERAPGAAGRVGGVQAWNEMEEGDPGRPLPFLPPFLHPRRSGTECARVFARPVGQGAFGRALPEGGLGGSGAAARAEQL